MIVVSLDDGYITADRVIIGNNGVCVGSKTYMGFLTYTHIDGGDTTHMRGNTWFPHSRVLCIDGIGVGPDAEGWYYSMGTEGVVYNPGNYSKGM